MIRIQHSIRVKSWIQIRIRTRIKIKTLKLQRIKTEPCGGLWMLTLEARRLKLEPWRVTSLSELNPDPH
jgi:hypothetical protein